MNNNEYLQKAVGPVLKPLLLKCIKERPTTEAELIDFIIAALESSKSASTKTVCLKSDFNTASDFSLAVTMDDMTPAWLSKAFGVQVTSTKKRLCSEGQVGVTVVITDIEFQDPVAATQQKMPTSVAVKMHGPGDAQRKISAQLYYKELYVYLNMHSSSKTSDCMPLSMPQCLGVWYDASNPFEETEFFNLMMENLNESYTPFDVAQPELNMKMGDYVAAFREVAGLHDRFWDAEITRKPPMCYQTDPVKINTVPFCLTPLWDTLARACGSKAVPRWKKAFEKYAPKNLAVFNNTGMDLTMGNGGKDGEAILEEAMRRLQTAPMTIVHGDLNSGNVWRSRSNSNEYCFADWQVTMSAPAAWDFGTPMMAAVCDAPCNVDFRAMLQTYHDRLVELRPAVKTEYPYEKLYEHVRCSYWVFWQLIWSFISEGVLNSVDDGSIDPAKQAYTFDHWIYNILVNLGLINKQLGLSEMGEELLRAANARSDAK